jgi:hypothetical protein
MRSLQDLIDCQEGSGRFPNFQVGKGTEMGSFDSIDCQEGNRDIPYCQVGREEQVSLDQQMQLTEEAELMSLLMIGGIEVFLPLAQEEAEICVAGAATTEEQSTATVREEGLEQISEAAQEGRENEHSEEWLNDFGQGAEKKEAIALKLAAKEAKEQAGRFITPWEMELEMLEDWLNNPEPARELAEVELSKKVTEWKFSQEETAEMKFAAEWQLEATDEDEEESMGDHSDLPKCKNFLLSGRLHEQGQPLEQLDAVIEEIRRLMIRSARTTSKEKLSRKGSNKQQQQSSRSSNKMEQMNSSRG